MLQTESTFLTSLSPAEGTAELVTTARLRRNRRYAIGLSRELAASFVSAGALIASIFALGAIAMSLDVLIGFCGDVWVGAQSLATQALGELYAAIDRVSIWLLP